MAAGGVLSGANPMYNAADLAHQMRDANAKFVFTIPPFLPLVREGATAAGCEKIILLGEAEGTLSFASLLACNDPEPIVSSDPDGLAALPFSSGTTGLAKGVMLTHRTLVSNICQWTEAFPSANASPVVLAFLPMFHIFGFTIVTLCGFALGAKLVTVPRIACHGCCAAQCGDLIDAWRAASILALRAFF